MISSWSNGTYQNFVFCVMQRNWVFVTNSDFLLPIFFPPNGVNLGYLTLIFFPDRIYSLKYLRSTALDYKDIEIRKS